MYRLKSINFVTIFNFNGTNRVIILLYLFAASKQKALCLIE